MTHEGRLQKFADDNVLAALRQLDDARLIDPHAVLIGLAAQPEVAALVAAALAVEADTDWEDGRNEDGTWPAHAASSVHPRALVALRAAVKPWRASKEGR